MTPAAMTPAASTPAASTPRPTEHQIRLQAGAPRPLLSRTAENRLGMRHHEILESLESMFMARGFAGFTIGGIAAEVGCSRRTLYEIAPSKDQLVLVVLDRFLHKKGRAALAAIDGAEPVIKQIADYLNGGIEFQIQDALSQDLADDAPARRLVDRHYGFVTLVLERLVALGVDQGEFRPVTPGVVATTIAASALALGQPETASAIGLDTSTLVNEMLDIVLPSLLRVEDRAAS